MVKSIFFPLRSHDEDHLFEDPDTHFRSLPYHEEIPDLSAYGARVAPLTTNLRPYVTSRERIATNATIGLFVGLINTHLTISPMLFGPSAPRNKKWMAYWTFGPLFALGFALVHIILDPAISPYLIGRRAPMFELEATRHALNANYNLYESLDRVMHSRERITKQQFYNSYTTARLRQEAEFKERYGR